MVAFFSVTSTLDSERKGVSPEITTMLSQLFTLCIASRTTIPAQCYRLLCLSTWTAVQFESRLDGGDRGYDGSIRHDGSVHVDFLTRGEGGTKWQSIVGAAWLFCFHIHQLEEGDKQLDFANKV